MASSNDPLFISNLTSTDDKKKRLCIVPTCKGERFDLVHKFPMDANRAEEWREILNIPALSALSIDTIRKRYFVCARHFQKQDYKNYISRSLNKTAVPTVNLTALDNMDAILRAKQVCNESDTQSTIALELSLTDASNSQENEEVELEEMPEEVVLSPSSILTTKICEIIKPNTRRAAETLSIVNPSFSKNVTLKRVPNDFTNDSPIKRNRISSNSPKEIKIINLQKIIKKPPNILNKQVKPTPAITRHISPKIEVTKQFIIPKSKPAALKAPVMIEESVVEESKTNTNNEEKETPKLVALFELLPENLLNLKRQLSTNPKNILTSKNCGDTILDDNLIQILTNNNSADTDTDDEKMTDYLELQTPDMEIVKINYFWLRDHCRCEKCYNEETFQRMVNILDIPLDVKPRSCDVVDEELKIVWEDDHESSYELNFIYSNQLKKMVLSPEVEETKQILWDKDTVNASRANLNDLLCDDEVAKNIVKSLIVYGVALIDKCPANETSTEMAIKRLFPIQKTLFGEMWTFSDAKDHSDTAYTKDYLAPHTDNTYFNDAGGLQILHCIQHNGTGGETILMDGFKILSDLKESSQDTFDRLSETAIPSEYIESGKHHKYCAPIIKKNPITKEVEQIRYNLYDRAPLNTIKPAKIGQFYKDLHLLTREIYESESKWKFKLTPGTILIFDNWRVLHGRHAYTGKRVITGCYVSRTDFLSAARTMKIID